MDNKTQATVRSEAEVRRPPPVVLPEDLEDMLEPREPTNLAERMENWGSD